MAATPLFASESLLAQHLDRVAIILGGAVDASAAPRLSVNWNINPAIAGLEGEGCELVARNRGGRALVAPVIRLEQDLWAWLGYREEWAHEAAVGGRRRFSFRSIGMTVHFGVPGDLFKPQMFRAEWSGWAKWGHDGHYGFQAGNAGHPHWQFDALESLPDQEALNRAAQLREEIRSDQSNAREFGTQRPESDTRDIVTSQALSRIHFASAAAWWKAPPHDDYAHGPTRLQELEVWTERALAYMVAELGRLRAA
ncbi:MAG: hypothetical protein K2X61_08930 [Caulobacteraceae bacterium]|nr:hypothetical protein [Caulobacteraceae bacterium]